MEALTFSLIHPVVNYVCLVLVLQEEEVEKGDNLFSLTNKS